MKTKPIRSPKHLRRVRTLDCLIKNKEGEHCNVVPINAHHATFVDEGGMGEKVGDNYSLPLCWKHHSELHRGGEKTFWAKYGFSLDEVKEIATRLWRETNGSSTN